MQAHTPPSSSTKWIGDRKNNNKKISIKVIEQYKNIRRKLTKELAVTNNNPRETTEQTWIKSGPPTWLSNREKMEWNSIIDHSLTYCRNMILLPKWAERVEKTKEKARREILANNEKAITNFLKIIKNPRLMTGHLEEDKKFIFSLLPPPPIEGPTTVWEKTMENQTLKSNDKGQSTTEEEWEDKNIWESEEIGNLKRGEIWGPVALVNEIEEEIGFKPNIFKIISKAIYGSTKWEKFVIRSVHKFLQMYDEVEEKVFTSYMVISKDNVNRKIIDWKDFKKVIINRDIQITMYELNIIARLYDIQIRLFHEVETKDKVIFACKWQSCFCRQRVINLLHRIPNTWTLLRGTPLQHIYNNKQVTESSKDSLQARNENSNEEKLEKDSSSIATSFESARDFIEAEQELNIIKDSRVDQTVDKIEDNRELFFSAITAPSIIDNEDKDKDRKRLRSDKISRRDIWRKWKKAIRVKERNKRRSQIRKDIKKDRNKIASLAVYDFTTEKLTVEEISLLSKGETFSIANDKIEEDTLKVDIYNYNRRLRLHDLFREHNVEEVDETVLSNTNAQNTHTTVNNRHIVDNSQSRQTIIPKATIDRRGKANSNIINTEVKTPKTLGPKTGRQGFSTIRPLQQVNNSQRREITLPRIITEMRSKSYTTTCRQVQTPITTQPKITAVRTVVNKQTKLPQTNTIVRRQQPKQKATPKIVQNRITKHTDTLHTPYNNIAKTRNSNTLGKVVSLNNNLQDAERNIQTELVSNRKLPSSFDIDSKNRNLVRYNTCIQEESMLIVKDKIEHKDNITKLEREAIKTLKDKINNNKIVITKADKGSGIVVVDYDTYISKGTKYIEIEAKAYTRTNIAEEKIVQNIAKKRNKIVKQLRESKIISKETATYCIKQVEEKVTGMKFYYKVHKNINLTTMPLRPLQSCISAPTHHLSIVLTDILQPLLSVKNIPTFIYDTNQLLVRLSKISYLSNEDTLISSDVAALYPSIPHEPGLKAIEQFLKEATHFTIAQILILKSALELVITANFVKWNSQIYQQTSGVAMGTPVAVAYANIFMHWIDRELRIKAPYIIEHIRYIDDNLFILPIGKIDHLMEVANNILHPHIRYTYEKLDKDSEKGLPFLDTQLFISVDNTIESRLYTKQTDKHTYLLPSSFHPPHITKNIPAAVFSRIKRICSKEVYYISDAAKAIEWLTNRGYSKTEILRAKQKISTKDRLEMIDTIEQKRLVCDKESQKEFFHIPFVVTYSNRTAKIKKILKDRQRLLDTCFTHTKIRPRLVYRRQRNINDIFIQKSLRRPIQVEEQGNIVKCGEEEQHKVPCPCRGTHDQVICRCCAHLITEQKIKVKLFKQVTCNSKNLVYIIRCRQCEKMYIGETQQRLKDRLLQHLNNVWKLNQPLYLHFRLKHKPSDLTISVLETVKRVEPIYRKIREAWWINHLQTLEPLGFNVKLDCNQIYSNNMNSSTRPQAQV